LREMALTRVILALPLLVLVPSGCARTHPAETPTELRDELRIIAAAARAFIEDHFESDDICVARRITPSAALRSTELPTDWVQGTSRLETTRPQLSGDRVLADDRAIIESMGEVELGPSCAGTKFLKFARVQLGSDAALATASLRAPCSTSFHAFRLRQAEGAWQVVETRVLASRSDFSCPQLIPIRRQEGYFRLIGQRRINWLPVTSGSAPRSREPASKSPLPAEAGLACSPGTCLHTPG
jgi:hypothetical protein